MGMNKNILLLIILGSFFACAQQQEITNLPREYDVLHYMKIVNQNDVIDTLFITDSIPRKAKIYVASRTYTYQAYYIEQGLDTSSISEVVLIASNDLLDSKYTFNQVSITFINSLKLSDSIRLEHTTHNKTFSFWADSVKEGVIENIQEIWIHPVRFNQFLWTETIGYPQCMLPLSVNKTWTGQTSIPPNTWGDWGNSIIYNEYRVKDKKQFYLKNTPINCWEITCISKMNGKTASATYLFHEEFGFVVMDYTHYSGDRIYFKMIDFTGYKD